MFQAVENDLKVAAKARKEVENQAQRMLAQGMETQVFNTSMSSERKYSTLKHTRSNCVLYSQAQTSDKKIK